MKSGDVNTEMNVDKSVNISSFLVIKQKNSPWAIDAFRIVYRGYKYEDGVESFRPLLGWPSTRLRGWVLKTFVILEYPFYLLSIWNKKILMHPVSLPTEETEFCLCKLRAKPRQNFVHSDIWVLKDNTTHRPMFSQYMLVKLSPSGPFVIPFTKRFKFV